MVQNDRMNDMMSIHDVAVADAGIYKNEAHWAESDIKKSFYTGTYDRLQEIKTEADPNSLL